MKPGKSLIIYLSITLFFIILVTLFTRPNSKKTIVTDSFTVHYEDNAEKYAIASLKILEVSRNSIRNLGFYFPEMVTVRIQKSDRNRLSAGPANIITWEYKSINDFLAPEKSGYNNVYGLCHEMGHLCLNYNMKQAPYCLTVDGRESWAYYMGSLIVDSVHTNLGGTAWPDRHNYYETTGMNSFRRVIKSKADIEQQGFIYCAEFWYELSQAIGISNMYMFFNTINVKDINITNCIMYFPDILRIYRLDNEFIDEFQKNKLYLINKN